MVFLAFAAGHGSARAAAPTPSFTISASNVTMSNGGNSVVPYTLTSVNGFAGSIFVTCTTAIPPAGVKEPACGGGGPAQAPIPLAANATVTGGVNLVAYPTSGNSRLNQPGPGRAAPWALAGVLMLGFGLSRKRRRRSGFLLLAVGLLIGLTGINGCAGPATLTPGTYRYTVTATEAGSASAGVSTTVQVTVPPGIVIDTGPQPV